MEKLTCKVCLKEFSGRKNQIYCSTDCKNNYYNKKTRLMYISGKYGKKTFEQILDQQSSNNDRMIKALAVFDEKEKWFDSEIMRLKAEYTDLLKAYNKLTEDIDNIKKITLSISSEKAEFDAKMILAKGIGQMISPLVDRIIGGLDKMGKKE